MEGWEMIIKNKSGDVIFNGDNMIGANLSGANLSWANLSGANLSGANLSGADLSGADMRGANLSEANLRGANLSGADLRVANLSWADLSGADLSGANMRWANLRGADLRWANLRGANLRGADLREADLSEADLSGANLRGANLSGANLSGASGIENPCDILSREFVFNRGRLTCYKAIGVTSYLAPGDWIISPDAKIEEVANWNRADECGCGVNFGTLKFVADNYPGQPVWKCEISGLDLAGIVVPLNFDGKARCSRLRLVRKLSEKEIERLLKK
jgi:uncharacterized protein YjbI with pentapeptide repeats